MSLPELSNWDDTKTALHQAMQVLRSARLLGVDPMPVELEYSTIPIPEGATTGKLSFGGELQLDYTQGAIVYVDKNGNEAFKFALNGHTQTSLFDTVFQAFADAGTPLEPSRSKITESTPFNLDLGQAQTYAQVQWQMYLILSAVKGRMLGPQTPVALWPHGFDLSTIWFAEGMDEHNDPQMNFGFSPGTPDIGQPYFYVYAFPLPEGFSDALPDIFNWNTSWSTPGGYIRYDQFATADDAEGVIANALISAYQIGSKLLHRN